MISIFQILTLLYLEGEYPSSLLTALIHFFLISYSFGKANVDFLVFVLHPNTMHLSGMIQTKKKGAAVKLKEVGESLSSLVSLSRHCASDLSVPSDYDVTGNLSCNGTALLKKGSGSKLEQGETCIQDECPECVLQGRFLPSSLCIKHKQVSTELGQIYLMGNPNRMFVGTLTLFRGLAVSRVGASVS